MIGEDLVVWTFTRASSDLRQIRQGHKGYRPRPRLSTNLGQGRRPRPNRPGQLPIHNRSQEQTLIPCLKGGFFLKKEPC